MESQLMVQMESPPRVFTQWPRLLRMTAILTLIFSLGQIIGLELYFYEILQPPPRTVPNYTWSGYERMEFVVSLARAPIDLLMIAGAIILWSRGRGHRLLIMGLWLQLVLVILANVQYLVAFGRDGFQFLPYSIPLTLFYAAFPLLILLVLREFARSGQIADEADQNSSLA